MLVLADQGCIARLEAMRALWNVTAIRIHLYQNNLAPTTSSVIGDFTESTFSGYAALDIIGWAAAGIAAHVASMVAAARTFTRSVTGAGQNVYGYYVTNNANTVLLWAERDSLAPLVLTNLGDTYTVTPALTDQDLST